MKSYQIFILAIDNKVEEAMALWTQMQEEDTQPSDHFMWSLSELLKKNNLEVPFTVKKPTEKPVSVSSTNIPSDMNNSLTSQLDSCIKNNNINKSLQLLQIIHSRGMKLNTSMESKVIELLTRENRLNEAFEIAKTMLETSRPVQKNILTFLLGKLSEAGNVAELEYLNGKLSSVCIYHAILFVSYEM